MSAKLIAAALTGAAVGLLAEALSAATSAAVLSAHHVPLAWGQPGVLGAVAAVPLLAALFGMLGAGLGLLLRNTAAALGLALMWAFVIEGIIPALMHQPGIIRWLPEAAANAVLHGASPAATTLSAGAALAVLAGYAAVLAGAARSPDRPARNRHHHGLTSHEGRVPAAGEITSRGQPGPPLRAAGLPVTSGVVTGTSFRRGAGLTG